MVRVSSLKMSLMYWILPLNTSLRVGVDSHLDFLSFSDLGDVLFVDLGIDAEKIGIHDGQDLGVLVDHSSQNSFVLHDFSANGCIEIDDGIDLMSFDASLELVLR